MEERKISLKKVGFIGFGNMAQAIITGMISSGNYTPDEIGAYDSDESKLTAGAASLGITAFRDNEELVTNCETVVLAVKPNALQKVIMPLRDTLRKADALVVSIAAGQSIERLREYIGFDARIVRVMPNINAIANQAVSGYDFSENVSALDKETATKILESFGTSVHIDEKLFSAYSAIAGCSPAYVYLFVDALARVGVKYGLTKKEATEIVASAVIKSVQENGNAHDENLDKVVLNAIESAYNKDRGM